VRPEVAAGVKAGWLTFPEEPATRQMSRTHAQSLEAFDIQLARRMDDNGADHRTIARAVGCRLSAIKDLLNTVRGTRKWADQLQRLEQLEQENDAMRADLLVWQNLEVKP